jgi:hypothetical protein
LSLLVVAVAGVEIQHFVAGVLVAVVVVLHIGTTLLLFQAILILWWYRLGKRDWLWVLTHKHHHPLLIQLR